MVNGSGIGLDVSVIRNDNLFALTSDCIAEGLAILYHRLLNLTAGNLIDVLDRIAQISALGRLHSNRNVRCNVLLCSISVRLLVEVRYSFRIIAGFTFTEAIS